MDDRTRALVALQQRLAKLQAQVDDLASAPKPTEPPTAREVAALVDVPTISEVAAAAAERIPKPPTAEEIAKHVEKPEIGPDLVAAVLPYLPQPVDRVLAIRESISAIEKELARIDSKPPPKQLTAEEVGTIALSKLPKAPKQLKAKDVAKLVNVPTVTEIAAATLAQLPAQPTAQEIAALIEKPAPGKSSKITKVALEKNELFIWVDGKKMSAGTIKMPQLSVGSGAGVGKTYSWDVTDGQNPDLVISDGKTEQLINVINAVGDSALRTLTVNPSSFFSLYGTYDGSTQLISFLTAAGIAAGGIVGQPVPAPATPGAFFVVDVAGTAPPPNSGVVAVLDWIIDDGATQWFPITNPLGTSISSAANIGSGLGQSFRDITSGILNLRTIQRTGGSTDGLEVETVGDEINLIFTGLSHLTDAPNPGFSLIHRGNEDGVGIIKRLVDGIGIEIVPDGNSERLTVNSTVVVDVPRTFSAIQADGTSFTGNTLHTIFSGNLPASWVGTQVKVEVTVPGHEFNSGSQGIRIRAFAGSEANFVGAIATRTFDPGSGSRNDMGNFHGVMIFTPQVAAFTVGCRCQSPWKISNTDNHGRPRCVFTRTQGG